MLIKQNYWPFFHFLSLNCNIEDISTGNNSPDFKREGFTYYNE